MSKKFYILNAIIALSLIGCTLAPKYSRPQSPVANNWPAGQAYKTLESTNHPFAQDLNWQEFYQDPRLQNLIRIALENSRDLKLAALNVELARSVYGIQRNTLFPALNLAASGVKQRNSADLTRPGEPRTTEQYSVNFGLFSWEIDFFGRIRSLKDEALQEYLATEQARRSAQLLLVSSVANTYLALAADRENLMLAQKTFETQKEFLYLVQKQFDIGIATELELRQAQTILDTARKNIAFYTQLVAQDENALNLLVGTNVPPEILPSDFRSVVPPREISPGLSSDVLLRRPDVLQAEHMLKAANADIGAARAAFFPRISLTSAIGTASTDLEGLFKSGTGTWNFAPQLVMPIFDLRTWSALKYSKVQRQLILTQYEKSIQNAFREVADALALCGTIDDQLSAQESLVSALEDTCRLAKARYEKGIDSYLPLLDAQRSLYAAQQALVSVRLAKFESRIRLYVALGGGWNNANDTSM